MTCIGAATARLNHNHMRYNNGYKHCVATVMYVYVHSNKAIVSTCGYRTFAI